ncbi:nitrogen fixation protein [Paramesorhizobium deserti]|uniref:Nitrogen fixation protein n=1 Tax=Paramesorhizobium deserti TaxID=1494590 RepID=A0A135HXM1_9HYPH|nr:type VI secretion system accessory protein TagJ [Paramesorhizobium deserti]KXF77935.1 nitrogen fixation protein [Paramesorhizobium deserti]
MTPFQEIARLLAEDALREAVERAKGQVKADPTDKAARHLYIDLLILSADYEKADAQCALAATVAPDASMDFAHLRNQLRAMIARRAWFEAGETPTFPSGPTELDRAALALIMANRASEHKLTKTALMVLEDARGERPMRWNGKLFPDFRDLDDRTPHALEVLTLGGAYLWIDFSRIAEVTMEPIAHPRDLAFRRARLSLLDGVSMPVLLPAIYQGSGDNPKLLLGRETKWVKEASGITTGRGQRCFLAGEELVSLHDTTSIGNAALDALERIQDGQSA